jgi:hypothetical protein
MRLLTALPAANESAIQSGLISALEHNGREHSAVARPYPLATSIDWAFAKLLRYDREVHDSLSALKVGVPPQRVWRTPFYRSHRMGSSAGRASATAS